jgi:hypothetical protein
MGTCTRMAASRKDVPTVLISVCHWACFQETIYIISQMLSLQLTRCHDYCKIVNDGPKCRLAASCRLQLCLDTINRGTLVVMRRKTGSSSLLVASEAALRSNGAASSSFLGKRARWNNSQLSSGRPPCDDFIASFSHLWPTVLTHAEARLVQECLQADAQLVPARPAGPTAGGRRGYLHPSRRG